jgi:hypothetical protein
MPETSPKDSAKDVQILAKASYTPSPKAHEMMEKNSEGCQRSRESKISFRGPLPVDPPGNT